MQTQLQTIIMLNASLFCLPLIRTQVICFVPALNYYFNQLIISDFAPNGDDNANQQRCRCPRLASGTSDALSVPGESLDRHNGPLRSQTTERQRSRASSAEFNADNSVPSRDMRFQLRSDGKVIVDIDAFRTEKRSPRRVAG